MSTKNLAQQDRDQAIDRVESNQPDWMAAWNAAIYKTAQERAPFTSDMVLVANPTLESCPENRVAGAAFRTLSSLGIIEPTGRYVESKRRKSHARPKREWQLKSN